MRRSGKPGGSQRPGGSGIGGAFADDRGPLPDHPLRDQAADDVRIVFRELLDHALRRAPRRTGRRRPPGRRRRRRAAARLGRWRRGRASDVRAAEFRAALEDVRDVGIEEEEVHDGGPRDAKRARNDRPRLTWLRNLCLAWIASAACGCGHAADSLRDGDIIFHTSRSAQSAAIQRATHSPWSHMGVISARRQTVRLRGHRDGALHAARAVDRARRRRPLRGQAARARPDAEAGRRRCADPPPAGTPASPTTCTSSGRTSRIYCSELVWKMYRDALGIEIGARQKLREFDLADPR